MRRYENKNQQMEQGVIGTVWASTLAETRVFREGLSHWLQNLGAWWAAWAPCMADRGRVGKNL
jgi:hypothetical protein